MRRRILLILMLLVFLVCPAMAQRYRQHQVAIVDEFGDPVTNIDIITIIDAGTSSNSTIYPTRAGGTMTNPITPTSTGSRFDPNLGLVSWFQSAPDYKITVTESGTSTSLTLDNRNEGDTRFPFYLNYIGTAASLTVGDDNLLNIGTSADFTHDWDNANSRYIIAPASDNSGTLHFGKAAVHADIYWHTGDITTDYVLFSQGSANVQFVDIDLLVDDEAKLLIGDSGDVTIEYDESNEDLDILSTSALDLISFGATGDGYDLEWFSTTAGDYVLFDYSEDKVLFEDVGLMIGDGELLEFGDTTATDIDVYFDGTKNQLEILDNDGDTILQILGFEAKEARLILAADEDDDATDQWQISVDTSGVLAFGNDTVADTFTDKLSIAAATGNVSLTGDIVNESADTILMNTDDSYIFTSNDENVTIQIQGHSNAKSAILDLSADAAADNVDTWNFTVADGGALTIANDATATMTISEAVDMTSTITLADDEILSNAGDVVDITGDDGATTFAIRGYTGNFSAVLEISADDAADDADTWLLTVADGGAATLANDSTATLTISEAVTVSGVLTAGAINQPVVEVGDNTAYDVLATNTGKVHVIPDLTGDLTMDLPTEAAGLYFKFIYVGGAEDAQDWIIDSENNTNFFTGGLMTIDDDDHSTLPVYSDNTDDSICKIDTPGTGTVVEIWCDGTIWFISGTVVSGTDTAVAFSNL